jgi:recombination DNA repair RAD52 pathway protein
MIVRALQFYFLFTEIEPPTMELPSGELTMSGLVDAIGKHPHLDDVEIREGASGCPYAYLNRSDVVSMLNMMFGVAWSIQSETKTTTVEKLENNTFKAISTATCDLRYPMDHMIVHRNDIGSATSYGPSQAEAKAASQKAAWTDALKRAASTLGPAFGSGMATDAYTQYIQTKKHRKVRRIRDEDTRARYELKRLLSGNSVCSKKKTAPKRTGHSLLESIVEKKIKEGKK